VLVLLASNLPALALQPLLPILALGRPAIVKSARAEPLFAPAFVTGLARREAACGAALAALTWRGGDAELEAPLLAAAGRVIAYGGAAAMADLERRAGGKLLAYGPKVSLAVVGPGADPRRTAAGLARDVALFDQRGCLSVVAVYCAAGMEEELAGELAAALADRAAAWPPGPPALASTSAVRQARDEAAMRDLLCHELGVAEGTVIVEPRPALRPAPGLRTVRVHPLGDLSALAAVLAPWRDRLQGVALAGLGEPLDSDLRRDLHALGVSRFAPPGDLQTPDACWHNGGIDPLRALAP
jgi:acyl-CoA reductase-like NAD-dependent aldehyde dehydrogenase